MVCIAMIVLGFGIYQLITIKYDKKASKGYKSNSKQKPKTLQLTTQFLEP